jgi:hypothetical protein
VLISVPWQLSSAARVWQRPWSVGRHRVTVVAQTRLPLEFLDSTCDTLPSGVSLQDNRQFSILLEQLSRSNFPARSGQREKRPKYGSCEGPHMASPSHVQLKNRARLSGVKKHEPLWAISKLEAA